MKHIALSLLATAALLQACGGGDSPQATPLGFTEIENTAFSAIATPRTVVVMDDATWTALWAEHQAQVTPPPPKPTVNFAGQSVAAIFLGDKPACNRPRVDSVVAEAGLRILVNWTHVPPQPNELCIAAMVRPALMVRLDNPQRLPVEFVQAR